MKNVFCLSLIALSFFNAPVMTSGECRKETFATSDLSSLEKGYCDHANRWVPGLITERTYRESAPIHTFGTVVWYSEGVMEATAQYVGVDLATYVDGVSLMSCTDFKQEVWLKRPGFDWEGPFIVVDCAKRRDMFSAVYYNGEVAELGYKTANAWGLVETVNGTRIVHSWSVSNVEVYKGSQPPLSTSIAIDYRKWWLGHAKLTNGEPIQ